MRPKNGVETVERRRRFPDVVRVGLIAVLVALNCFAQAPVQSQTPGGTIAPLPHETYATRTDSQTADSDATQSDPTAFIKSAAMGELAEFEFSRLAMKKSSDGAIRRFAGRMVQDYRAANVGLTAIARSKGFDVPTVLDGEDRGIVDIGARKPAAEFDAWYVALMISEQAKAVELFQDAAHGTDLDLAGFAKTTLPTLFEDQTLASVLPIARNQ